MAQIKQFDKRSGITYVYESTSYWDKEKKQPRSHRTLIGRLDTATGEIVPTDGRGKRRSNPAQDDHTPVEQSSSTPISQPKETRLFYGATYLLDQIGISTGVEADLKRCFPKTYKQILSIAYYLILEEGSPLSRFKKWGQLHKHPFGTDIPSQRSSDLFQSITEEAKNEFFRLQAKKRMETEYWAYDTTSISSYSECLHHVKYGKNKDGDDLPQFNIALLFGEKSHLPFYYRKLAGNIPDVKTIRELIRKLDVLGYEKVKLVMDRGFYSAANINQLYKAHMKFLVSCKSSLSYVKDFIQEIGTTKEYYANYHSASELYMFSKTIHWDYEQDCPYKKDTLKSKKRMYLHLYYNPEKAYSDRLSFNKNLDALREELQTQHRNPAHEKEYAKYFIVKETPARGISIRYNEEAIQKVREGDGFFALISNDIKDPVIALQMYRLRDLVEKGFGNLKDRLNLRRTLTSSDSALDGKLFVEFIALIYLSYIKKKMDDASLFGKYTLHGVLDELDIIECFEVPGKDLDVGEVLKKQEQLYGYLGITPLHG